MRNRYFITYMLLIAGVIITLSGTMYLLSLHILKQKLTESQRDTLSYFADRIEKDMLDIESIMDSFFVNQHIQRVLEKDYRFLAPSERYYDHMEALHTITSFSPLEIFNSLQLIYMTGNNGEDIVYGMTDNVFRLKRAYLINSELFQQAEEQLGVIVSPGVQKNYVRFENHSEYVIPFARSFVKNRNFLGIAYVELSIAYFEQLLRPTNSGLENQLYLIDQQGRIIYHPNAEVIGTTFQESPEDILASYTLPSRGWRLISAIPNTSLSSEYSVIITITLIAMVVAVVVGGIMVISATGQVEKRNQAEYEALQAQIHPHFLYNTLNSIRWMAMMEGESDIKKMIDALAGLLKHVSNKKGLLIPLKDELELVSCYLALQEMRYEGRFEVKYQIDQELLSTMCPKFILQPIVENALFHGIEPAERFGRITITVSQGRLALGAKGTRGIRGAEGARSSRSVALKSPSNAVVIAIRDNGVGMSQEQVATILEAPKPTNNPNNAGTNSHADNNTGQGGFTSIGLYNVHQRIQMIFSKRYGLTVSSKLGEYTEVIITIPRGA